MLDQATLRRFVFIATFFSALHYALTLYVESTYLGQFFPEHLLGLFFGLASFASLAAGIYLPRFLARNGNYRAVLIFIGLEMATLVGLAFVPVREIALPLFLLHQVLLAGISISINVLLESLSRDNSTGRIRGLYLTILNAAILLGPLAAGLFYHGEGFSAVFLAAAVLLVPVFVFVAGNFKHYRDPVYRRVRYLATLGRALETETIYRVSALRFLLEFFYSVMVIYTPLYLHTHLGISFSAILGVIMPVALLPFVILPYLLGKIADLKFGEKEMVVAGFIILSATTAALSFVETSNIFVWAGLLLLTRIGAAFIESMTESYFFKQVNGTDSDLIAFFVNLRPAAFMVAPLVAVLFLLVFDLRYIFLALGVVSAYGLRHAFLLKDTR